MRIGNKDVFEKIYRQYWKELFDIAYRRIKSVEKTEEIIQELFINLWEKRDQIEIHESIGGYLFKALKFRVLNYLRNEIVRTRHLNNIKLSSEVSIHSTYNEVYLIELEESLEREINNLPEKCREVFILSRTYNMSFKEIAEKLNISVNTVEKHISKALKFLRVRLKDFASVILIAALTMIEL